MDDSGSNKELLGTRKTTQGPSVLRSRLLLAAAVAQTRVEADYGMVEVVVGFEETRKKSSART